MENLLGELLETLKRQVEVYAEIRALAEKKKEKLLDGDISSLEKVVMAEEMLIVRSGRLEERRLDLVTTLKEKLEIPPEGSSLEAICQAIGDPGCEALQGVAEELVVILDDIAVLNDFNKEIIETSLAYVDYSMNLLTGTSTGPSGYSGEGQSRQEPAKPSLLDKRW